MPDDDFLQSILGNDEDENEETGATADPKPENKTIAQMRGHIDKLDKALKKTLKENEELKGFKVQVTKAETESKVGAAFSQIWTDAEEAERNTKLFFRGITDPEQVTEETLSQFVNEFGPKREPDASQTETGAEPGPYSQLSAKFAPTPEGEPPVKGVLTSEDMTKLLMQGDAEAVNKAVTEGRFKKSVAPWPTAKG